MRILVISNLYPPHHLGGYEVGCEEAVKGLQARGHAVRVLTSDYGIDKPASDGEVYRWLRSDFDCEPRTFPARAVWTLRKEVHNQRAFRRLTSQFSPDVVYLWNLSQISISMAWWAQRLQIPTCFYVFDKWLTTWKQDGWYSLWPPAPRRRSIRILSNTLRLLLERFGIFATDPLDLSHVQFASEFLKGVTMQAGAPVAAGEVIHWGVELERFHFRKESRPLERWLLVGQIGPHKGVHTALEALKILVGEPGGANLRLAIAGSAILPDYEAALKTYVKTHNLEDKVEFRGFIPRERLTEVYREHDLLLWPSVCDEGLGLGLLEAMASGLSVVGTASGGSAEILKHEETGLVFPREDAQSCASEILRLMNDRELADRLRRNGRGLVEEEFRIEESLSRIAESLLQVVKAKSGLNPTDVPPTSKVGIRR